jgi:hypothetical protein
MKPSTVVDIEEFLAGLKLEKGSHEETDRAYCVMEAVAYIAGEPHSDHPKCASKVLTTFCMRWNDALPDEDRQILKPFVPRLVGTAGSAELERIRGYMAADWVSRRSSRRSRPSPTA